MNICIFLQSGFQLCTRKWFGIASGLHRDCIGNGSEKSGKNFDFFLRLHRTVPEETSKKFRTNLEPLSGLPARFSMLLMLPKSGLH